MPQTEPPTASHDPAAQAVPAPASGPGPAAVEATLCAPGAPFAVVAAEDGSPVYASGPRTLREFVEAVWAFGDQPFLVAESGTYTYGEFFAAASALARRFVDVYGLLPGDRAVVAMRNHPEWQIAFWAAELAGLVAVPLNAWWTEDEFTYALDDCRPRVLLVDGERLGRVLPWAERQGAEPDADAGPWIVAFHHDGTGTGTGTGTGNGNGTETETAYERFERYVELPAADPALGPPDVEVRPEDDATIIYTSGTTGRPKGAVATHLAQVGAMMNPLYHAAASALARGTVPGQGPAPVALMTFPFFHVAAFTSVYAAMSAGGTLVLMRKWDAEKALTAIRAHGVTFYAGVPATALQLLDAAERSGDGLESLVMLSTGGAAAPPDLVRTVVARHGGRIEPRNGYGLTETCGGVLANFGAEYRAHPESVGRPTPATEVRIADRSGRALGDGDIGELWLRGQALVRGYWNAPEATAAAFQDGWFRTGDLATVHEGRVNVVDRIKDMVVRGGENVYCVEVEAALHAHPDVLDAAVLGVAHPVLGEEVAAVVQLRDGSEATPDVLRAHVGETLAAFKVPAYVFVRAEPLPRNATGKVLKRELRGPVQEQVSQVSRAD
ncbi:class I adenylate-forming enzyme family protein [Streptomyces sp. NBC_01306]|uniref:class I adenylate-forming enzyme family protein n=1 Tax=Streptomyces sp. NBC_01306 TaxID=2903819 RepID=UPI00224F3455|nr:class I adenylate-forming enzyme family protein [Streptomyces sp. NBC_01306]MCX4725990.1 acyl--CoA ligase [Streptomyces sp. NBC_01306]